jgi:hypothetical protein
MTPSAATAAARKPAARAKPAVRAKPAAARAKPAARASVKPKASPRPAAKASARAASRTSPRPARGRSRGGRATVARGSRSYRRTSGPARARTAERALPALPSLPRLPRVSLPLLRPVPVLGVLGARAYRVGRALPESRLLDRLMRGRIWIGLLAVLLFGLVFLNVSLLKLNSEAGRNADKVKALRIENDRLHAKVSRLQGGDRLERVAGRLGLVMPEPGNVHYMSVSKGDAARAARALRAGRRAPRDGLLEGAVPTSPASGPALPIALAAPISVAPTTTAPATATAPPDTAAATPGSGAPAAPPAATAQGPTGQTAPVPVG